MATDTVTLSIEKASTDGGASVVAVNGQMYPTLSASATGSWYFKGRIPDNYASGGQIKVKMAANATSGAHRISVNLAARAEDESINASRTGLTAQDVTVPGTAYYIDTITFSSGLPTLAAGDFLDGELVRSGAHANDTLAVTSHLVGVYFFYTLA